MSTSQKAQGKQRPRDIWPGWKLKILKQMGDARVDSNDITNHFFNMAGWQEWDVYAVGREYRSLNEVLQKGLDKLVLEPNVQETIRKYYAKGYSDADINTQVFLKAGDIWLGDSVVKQTLQYWKFHEQIEHNAGDFVLPPSDQMKSTSSEWYTTEDSEEEKKKEEKK